MSTQPAFGECVYDYATQTWWWSDEMYAVAGLTRTEADPAELLFKRMHEDDRESVASNLAAALEEGAPISGQYRLYGEDDRLRSIAFVGDAERDADGELVRMRGFGFDVTGVVEELANAAVSAATTNRAAIEQVKGALRFAYGLDDEAAFGILSRYSQASNVKLGVIAQRAVERLGTAKAGDVSVIQVIEEAAAGA
jgi:hypothetical protein